MLAFKETVRIDLFAPAIHTLLEALAAQSDEDGQTYTITSAHDGVHSGPDDPHFRDQALDIRTHDLPNPSAFAAAMAHRLGGRFTVLLESQGTPNAHLHLQVRIGATFP